MKKALAIILAISFGLCLTACNKDETTSDVTSNNTSNISQTASTENQIDNTVVTTESTKTSDLNNPTTVNNITEEQVRQIVRDEIDKTEKPSVSVNNLTEEQIRKIVQEELSKTDINSKDEFKIGDKLFNPLGNNFKLPINGQDNRFATITTLEVTNKKEANPSDINDYWKSGNYHYFARYIYEVRIVGNVDAKFAGREIYINLQFENYNEFFGAGGDGKTTIKSDGTFEFNYLAYSNMYEKVIIPHSAYIT